MNMRLVVMVVISLIVMAEQPIVGDCSPCRQRREQRKMRARTRKQIVQEEIVCGTCPLAPTRRRGKCYSAEKRATRWKRRKACRIRRPVDVEYIDLAKRVEKVEKQLNSLEQNHSAPERDAVRTSVAAHELVQ